MSNIDSTAQAPAPVLILGAGIAGLTAGLMLVRAGYEVTILEASDRPGGRIQTLRDGFSDGVFAEAGATFLHLQHTFALSLVKQLGLETQAFDVTGKSNLYLLKGHRIQVPPPPGVTIEWPYPMRDDEQGQLPQAIAALYTSVPAGFPRVNPYSPDWPPSKVADMDLATLTAMMRERNASPGAVEFLSTGLNALTGYGPGSYSALLTLAENWFLTHHGLGVRVAGGNDRITNRIADLLGGRIRYGTRVTAVSEKNGMVRVSVESNGKTEQIETPLCICAIPFSVVRHIPFDPPLSPAKAAAVRTIPYTAVTRIYCEFKRNFWADQQLTGLAVTDLPVMVTYSDFGQFAPRGVLEIYLAGQQALNIGALSDADKEAFALDQFETVFPGYPRDQFVGSVSKSWDCDPNQNGAYPWFLPGQMSTLLGPAVAPHGRVHFAGDHCSVLPGWIEGALRSAQHVVSQITGQEYPDDTPPVVV